jgi:hypothetical protein
LNFKKDFKLLKYLPIYFEKNKGYLYLGEKDILIEIIIKNKSKFILLKYENILVLKENKTSILGIIQSLNQFTFYFNDEELSELKIILFNRDSKFISNLIKNQGFYFF